MFENQKEVEKEAKVLQKKVDAFKCESRTWVKSLRDFDESLKSIGDFENYVMTLENELKGIAEELKKRKEHWTDQAYIWHVNGGSEVFAVLDGRVEMFLRKMVLKPRL